MTSFRVLGPVEAWSDKRRLVLGGPRQVKLLAFLLLNANRAVSADAVIDAVWGAERDGAVKRLQMGVLRLRKALAPLDGQDGSRLRTVSGGYLLSVGPVSWTPRCSPSGCGTAVARSRRVIRPSEPAAGRGAGILARTAAGGGRVRGLRPGRDPPARGAPAGRAGGADRRRLGARRPCRAGRRIRGAPRRAAHARAPRRPAHDRAVPIRPPSRRPRGLPAHPHIISPRARARTRTGSQGPPGRDP